MTLRTPEKSLPCTNPKVLLGTFLRSPHERVNRLGILFLIPLDEDDGTDPAWAKPCRFPSCFRQQGPGSRTSIRFL